MGGLAKRFSMLTMAVLLGVSLAWAQQGQSPQQAPAPVEPTSGQPSGNPSASSPEAPLAPISQTGAQKQSGEENQGEAVPSSTVPLTGAEQYTLGHMGTAESYFVPSFQFGQSVSTIGTGAFGTSNVEPVSTVSGLIAFHHLWSRYDLTAQYAGTGFIYNQQSALNTSAHEFSVMQRIEGRRSTFLLSDVVTYMPEASFGYARFSGFSNFNGVGYGYGGLFGSNAGGLDTSFLPSQSILTGPSTRVSNSVMGEYDYQMSPLSSLTLTGSYALLRFPSADFINSDDAMFRLGYNHTLTPKDSVGVAYQAGIFRFNQSSSDFVTHVASLTYRRTISRRMAMQFGAGPQINVFSSSAPGQDTNLDWQASAWLSYQLRRSVVAVNYQHYTSGGSGVYLGARTDDVGVYFSVPVSRTWSVDTDMGYAHNTTVQSGNLPGAGRSYDSWYGSVNFHRVLNRWLSLFVSYNLQQQLAATPTCLGSMCGTFSTQQYFSIGLNWHPVLAGVE
ncbi:MAG TPA: hypothetical protein VNJ12_03500 [Candidatus Dormibacteraeota bacterium]|nr:hypothetical protein [Candidatus Dormibacteraeota bacterium]